MSFDRESAWLSDIIENADRAIAHLEDMTFDDFLADRKTIDAVERCIERLAEATIRIGAARFAELTGGHSLAPIRGIGNALRHGYDRIDLGTIFQTARNDLPALRSACATALRRTSPDA